MSGVHVTRLVPKRQLRESALAYFRQVARFSFVALGVMTARSLKSRYDLIHVHNMPDLLVFAALVPRMRGAKIVLDLHDLVPELFVDKSSGWRASLAGVMLRLEEKISAQFAHHVIVSNHLWIEEITSRSAAAEKCSVFINNVDSRVFRPRTRTRSDDRKIILFHGTLSKHQGVDLVVQAMPAVIAQIPDAEFHIYGSGSEQDHIEALARKLGLVGRSVQLKPSVVLQEIPQIIVEADVGVVAKRADSFGNRAYSTKILEFMSQGVPVVLSRTEIDQFYFDENVARFFTSGNVGELAQALVDVLSDADLRRRLIANGRTYVTQNDWATRQREYLDLVDGLIEGRDLLPRPTPPASREAPVPAAV